MGIARNSKEIPPKLQEGDVVEIVDIRIEDDRMRGKLATGGWISIKHTTNNYWVWARQQDNTVKSMKPYLGEVHYESENYQAAIFPTGVAGIFNVTIMDSELAFDNDLVGHQLFDVPEDQITANESPEGDTIFLDDESDAEEGGEEQPYLSDEWIGTWSAVATENFEEYLKAKGAPWAARKMVKKIMGKNWVYEMDRTDDGLSITLKKPKESHGVYVWGKEVSNTKPNGKQVRSTARLVDGDIHLNMNHEDNDNWDETVRTMEPGGNRHVLTMTCKGVSMKRVMEKVEDI